MKKLYFFFCFIIVCFNCWTDEKIDVTQILLDMQTAVGQYETGKIKPIHQRTDFKTLMRYTYFSIVVNDCIYNLKLEESIKDYVYDITTEQNISVEEELYIRKEFEKLFGLPELFYTERFFWDVDCKEIELFKKLKEVYKRFKNFSDEPYVGLHLNFGINNVYIKMRFVLDK